jgi:CRP/FNR family transcriptional regulator, cyclic AMP receptor protein
VETLEPLLKEHPFFRDLAPGVIQLLTGCAKNVRLEAGQVIFREGEDADQFYLIRDGRVALEVFTPRGPAPILTISAGEALGWSWLIPPYKWRFDARATETTRALALDGKCLREKCDEDPPSATNCSSGSPRSSPSGCTPRDCKCWTFTERAIER